MSANHTPKYNLCQWEAGDKVIHTDFNEDNRKIEAAIKAVDDRISGVADAASGLTQKGNCTIQTYTYHGNGIPGSVGFTFKRKPWFVFVCGDGLSMILARDILSCFVRVGSSGYTNVIAWRGNQVVWENRQNATAMLNADGVVYQVAALIDAEE